MWRYQAGGSKALIYGVVFGCCAVAEIATWLNARKLKAEHGGDLQLRLAPTGYGKRPGKGDVMLSPWQPGIQITAAVQPDGRFLVSITRPGERFWFPRFIPIHAIFDGGESAAAQFMDKIAKWWGLPVTSSIHARTQKRRLGIGPLTEEMFEQLLNTQCPMNGATSLK
jgi:hypothetical protein